MAKESSANDLAANDQDIISGRNNMDYLYSVNDVHNIAIALRKKYLNYDGKEEVPDGNNYNALRENNNNLLLLDPCNVQNIENHLSDEIRKLVKGEQGIKAWQHMPQTIIIPFLTAGHWISMKVDIELDSNGNNSVSLLWDNPYGLSYELGEYRVDDKQITSLDIIGYVRSSVEKLIKHYGNDSGFELRDGENGNWILNYQQMDQQGIEVNGVSCGTVTMQNIEDYIDARVNHGNGVPAEYTIPSYKDNVAANRDKLQAAKKEHIKMYASVVGKELPGEEAIISLNANTANDSLLDDINDEDIDKKIANLEERLFANRVLDKDIQLPNLEEEKQKAIKASKEAHRKSLEYLTSDKLKAAEDEIVKVLRPVLSKPESKSLYISITDIPQETLSSLYNLGTVKLKDKNNKVAKSQQ